MLASVTIFFAIAVPACLVAALSAHRSGQATAAMILVVSAAIAGWGVSRGLTVMDARGAGLSLASAVIGLAIGCAVWIPLSRAVVRKSRPR
jgi:hypothetical protein